MLEASAENNTKMAKNLSGGHVTSKHILNIQLDYDSSETNLALKNCITGRSSLVVRVLASQPGSSEFNFRSERYVESGPPNYNYW